MASFGHVAVGLLTGRLHGGAGTRPDRPTGWRTLALFAGIATLPDADVLLVALGTSDTGPFGHRGALHSLSTALVVALACAIGARRAGWPVRRTAVAGALAVASHTLLDLLGAGGKSLAVFWPLTTARYHSPWRLLPDAPRGWRLLSRTGLLELALEFALFLPVTIYALWPYLWSHLAPRLRRLRRPTLQVIDGEGTPRVADGAPPNSVDRDPSIRSSG